MRIFRDFEKNHRKLTITIGLLYLAMLDLCVANEKVHIIFCYMHPLI